MIRLDVIYLKREIYRFNILKTIDTSDFLITMKNVQYREILIQNIHEVRRETERVENINFNKSV